MKPPGAPWQDRPIGSAPSLERQPFLRMLGGALFYPVSSGAGVGAIVVGAIFFSIALMSPGIFGFVFGGVLVAYYFEIMQVSGLGRAGAPTWPDVAHPWDYVSHAFRWSAAFVAAFLPAGIVLFGIIGLSDIEDISTRQLALLGGSIVLGSFYLPMALMLAGFTNSWVAPFNYLAGIVGIWRLGLDYL